MSADNGIFILVTKDNRKRVANGATENTFGEGVIAYRVAHAQAIDNLDWYEKKQPYNVGYFLDQIWGHCTPYYDAKEAQAAADFESDLYYILEYGICKIERLQYSFPGY